MSHFFLFLPLAALSQVSSYKLHQPHLALQCYSWANRWVIVTWLYFQDKPAACLSFYLTTYSWCPQVICMINAVGLHNDPVIIWCAVCLCELIQLCLSNWESFSQSTGQMSMRQDCDFRFFHWKQCFFCNCFEAVVTGFNIWYLFQVHCCWS